jgi:hypothetical protein
MESFLALIVPVGGAPGTPAHPIAPGGPPPGIWGGAPIPGYPAHPIAPGGPPPGFWGGTPAWPSHPIAPGGRPPFPSQGPGFPTHPIAPGGQPPGTWGGANEPFPTPPIFIGPPVPAPEPPPVVEWHSAWSSETGWMTVGVPTGEAPTPSTG